MDVLNSVTSLVPFEDPQADTLTLEHCVTLLRNYLENEWMRTFLLGLGGSSSDLSILTSKTHIQHAFVGNLNVDFSGGATGYHNLFSQNLLIVPAFCFGNYSALIFAEERHGNDDGSNSLLPENMRKVCSSRNMFSHGIRDELSGTLLKIDYDDSTFAKIMVFKVDPLSKARQRAVFRIEKSILEAGDFETMKTQVDVFTLISDFPACKVCMQLQQANTENFCVCEQPKPVVPSHPLDLAVVANNFKLVTGVFTGTVTAASIRNFQDDPPISVVVGMLGANEPEPLTKRLLSWTLSHALTKYFSQSMPRRPPFSSQLVSAAHQIIAENLADLNSTSTSNNLLSTSNATSAVTADLAFQGDRSSNRNDLLLPFPTSPDIGAVIADPFTSDSCDNLQPPAPLPTIIPALTAGVSLHLQPLSTPMDSLEAKDRIRKLRNRESAARSNLKKRLKIAALKQETADAKEYQVKLKQKLEELKRVNRTLRLQVEPEQHAVQTVIT